jgi:hypothetical protein
MTTPKACPGYIRLSDGTMDACPACYAGRLHRPAPSNNRRTCQGCGNSDCRGWLDCIFCGGPMLSPGEVPRSCVKCGAVITNHGGHQKYCNNCTSRDTLRRREKRAEAFVKPVKPRVRCASCRHGTPSTVAETGWECLIVMAGRCRPFSEAALYVKR